MSKDVRNFLIGATLFFAAGPLFRAATNAFVAGSTGSAAFFYNAGRALRFIGINTMIDAGLNALAPKPRVAPVARESLVTSGVGAALLGYGECRVSGQMVWYGGTPDQRQVDYVIAHSLASPCGVDSIGDVIVNGVTIPDADIDGNGDITDGQFQGVLAIQRQVGTDSDTTWTALDNSYVEWTSDHRGRGVAKTWLRVTHSGNEKEFAEAFGGGLVTSAFVIGKWQKVYDPRKDGSRIGTGAHRIDDPNTWEWSSNPALIARDYLSQPKRRKTGEYYKPPAYWTDERLTYVASAANVCDELVESPAGNIKRFEFHGFLDLSRPPRENLRAILESMVGTWDASSGRLFAAAYEAPVASIDDTWLRGESRWIPYEPRARRFNTWRGKYYSSAGGWEEVQTEELVDSAAVTADGATILKEPELVGTRDEYHGQIIGTIHLRRAQLGGTLFLPCNWKALDVRYWDTVTVTLPEHGLDGEVMKIVKWTLDSDNGPSLVLIRESEDIYPMVLGDFTARTITGPGGKVVLQPPAPDQPTHRVNAGVIELNTAASLPSAWDFTVWERAPDAGGSPGTWGEIGEVRGTRFTDAPAAGTYHYRVRVRSKSYDYSGYSDPEGPIAFEPAEEGADVTADNTAADTAAVNGVAAATVQAGSAAGTYSQNQFNSLAGGGYFDELNGGGAAIPFSDLGGDTQNVNGVAAATVQSQANLGNTANTDLDDLDTAGYYDRPGNAITAADLADDVTFVNGVASSTVQGNAGRVVGVINASNELEPRIVGAQQLAYYPADNALANPDGQVGAFGGTDDPNTYINSDGTWFRGAGSSVGKLGFALSANTNLSSGALVRFNNRGAPTSLVRVVPGKRMYVRTEASRSSNNISNGEWRWLALYFDIDGNQVGSTVVGGDHNNSALTTTDTLYEDMLAAAPATAYWVQPALQIKNTTNNTTGNDWGWRFSKTHVSFQRARNDIEDNANGPAQIQSGIVANQSQAIQDSDGLSYTDVGGGFSRIDIDAGNKKVAGVTVSWSADDAGTTSSSGDKYVYGTVTVIDGVATASNFTWTSTPQNIQAGDNRIFIGKINVVAGGSGSGGTGDIEP